MLVTEVDISVRTWAARTTFVTAVNSLSGVKRSSSSMMLLVI